MRASAGCSLFLLSDHQGEATVAKGQTTEPATIEASDQPAEYKFDVGMPWGAFEFGALTVRDMIQLRPKIREHWGGPLPINGTPDGLSDLNSYEYALASALAEMEVACRAAPEGWNWTSLRDPDRAWELWLEYQKRRDAFRDSLGGF